MSDWPGQEVTPAPSAPPASTLPPLRTIMDIPDKPSEAIQAQKDQLDIIQKRRALGMNDDGTPVADQYEGLTGPALLQKLPHDEQALVQGLLDGRIAPPTGTASKDPQWQQRLKWAAEIDPTFDTNDYAARAKARASLQNGTVGKSQNALNTALAHAGSLMDLIPSVAGHSGFGPLNTTVNSAQNAYERASSDPSIKEWDYNATQLANELEAAYTGGQGTEQGRQQQLANIDANLSSDAKTKVLHKAIDLLASKMAANFQQYSWAFRDGKPTWDMLDPQAMATLQKYAPDVLTKYFAPPLPKDKDGGASPPPGTNPGDGSPPSNGGGGGGTPQDVTGAAARANGITFGPQDTGAFDRNAYLQKTYGVSADQEAALVGDWNAVSGNKNLTVEQGRQIYESVGLPPPDDATLQQQVMNARKGAAFQGIDTTAAEKAYTDQLDAAIAARGDNPESFGETAGINLGQGITLNGLDELAGVGGAVRALTQGNNPVAGYQAERDIQRREQDRSEAAHPIAAPVFNVAGGALTAPLAFGDATTVADAVKAGAALGGVAGFNSGRGAGESLTGAVTGAGLGAGLGVAGDKATSALAARAARKAATAAPSEGAETMAAANRLNEQFGSNIQPMPADVSGPGIRNLTGGAAKFPASAQPIIAGSKRVTAEAQKARDAIAATIGNASATPDAAGETALNGALSYIKTSKTKVDALYAKARQLGGNAPVDLANARAALDQNIAELSQTPGGAPALTELKALRAELDKPFPVEGVRNMRTVLRDRFMGDGLRSTDLERRVGQVVDAAQQDVVNSLEAAGKDEAATAYAAAANAHSARVGVIDNVLEPIIGKNGDKSAEQVFQSLSAATKTKGAQLGKFLAALPKDDAATVRATLIGRLGQVPAGQQNAAGDAFSLSAFLTHWNQMSATAKAQLFGGETRAALDDLAKVAQGTKEAQRFANFSNTGGAIGIGTTMVQAGGALASPVSVAASLLAQYGGGRLLASPRFARWLVKMPANPAAAAAHVRSLSKIATADATIAPDILGLQQRLFEAFSGPTKLAAQPNSGTTKTGAAPQ